jgi:hypothetical protein
MASANALAPLRWKRAKIHRGSRRRRRSLTPHKEAGYTSAVVTLNQSLPNPVAIGRGPYTSRHVRCLRIPLKRPSSIPSDGEARSVSEKDLKGSLGGSWGTFSGANAASISGSIFTGLKRARRLRFWAVAARRNSSLASFGPLKRSRARRRIRLRWANSISTFFRRRPASDCRKSLVPALYGEDRLLETRPLLRKTFGLSRRPAALTTSVPRRPVCADLAQHATDGGHDLI